MPKDRYLEVHDLWPQQDGSFRLRDGYTLLKNGLQDGVPIHSITSVTGPAPTYTPIIVFWQNKTPYILNQSTSTITPATVKGTAIQVNARFCYFYANGHLHAFNGTDAKWFDGTYWRDIGLPTLTAAQLAAIGVATGFEAPSVDTIESAVFTLVSVTGGTWDVAPEGVLYYAFFDVATNDLAPCSQAIAGEPYPITSSFNEALNISGLPSSSLVTAVGLLSAQVGGSAGATFVLTSPYELVGCALSNDGNQTVTVTKAAHGLATGNVISLSILTDTPPPRWSTSGPFAITVINANTFTFQVADASNFTQSPANVFILKVVPHGTGTAQLTTQPIGPEGQGVYLNAAGKILMPYANSPSLSLIPASTIGGAQPGYQFYGAIYNIVTQHVGNRSTLGARIANTGDAVFILSGLPTFSDPEWVLLIGRTADGAEIPYAIIDENADWITSPGGTISIAESQIDGNSEIPYRNYPPPGTLDYNYQLSLLPGGATQNPPVTGTFVRAWMESDHMCGVLAGSPTIYRSGSAQDMREGVFVGLAEQSWDPADIETFPTANPVVCGQGYQQESWCFTAQDSAVLLELAGETQWQGPWNVGAAGQFAWAVGWNNLPFWVTGKKQLATISLGGYQQLGGLMSTVQAGPMIISGEYEAALLAKIGSQYLGQVEVVYIRIPEKLVDQLRINCLDANGVPFTVIHDFNLRDEKAPYGQAYEEFYRGPLTGQTVPSYTQASVRDQFEDEICIAGGQDGNLYEFYDGGNDAGTEFVGEAFSLISVGPERTAVKAQEWWGDSTVEWYVTKKLNAPISFGTTISTRVFDTSKMNKLGPRSAVQGEEWNSHWNVPIDDPEMVNAYVLMRLTSHSADGTTALNTPPHVPLETYGRVWMVNPLAGASRGR